MRTLAAARAKHASGQRLGSTIHALLLAAAGLLALTPAARAQYRGDLSTIVLDANTGNVLHQDSPDLERFPASLTKLMTLYMAFEALRDRRVTLDSEVPVSDHAASMQPSKLGLLPGSYLTVQEAVLALVTKSANDAASALGELLGGDEDRFGQMMTLRARALGMTHTTFRNASGLPDPDQMTTAGDLALLARHLISDFPDQYHYFSVPYFWFHGRMIPNHDPMLRTYPGADGLKTGFTDAAGLNLVTSAVRGNVRLIGVVLGARTSGQRSNVMTALLNDGFSQEGVPVPATPLPAPRGFGPRRNPGVVMAADTLMIGPIAHGRHHLSRWGGRGFVHEVAARFGHRHMIRMEAAMTDTVSRGGARIRAIHALRSFGHHHGAHHLIARAGRQHAANTRLADESSGAVERT